MQIIVVSIFKLKIFESEKNRRGFQVARKNAIEFPKEAIGTK